MPLQLDSTTRYATGNYTEPLTEAQLNSPSPYNTRNHKGLPPTPIDNPGLAAIAGRGASRAAPTTCTSWPGCAATARVCSTSNYNQFLADAAKYQQARSARHGKSPTRCS